MSATLANPAAFSFGTPDTSSRQLNRRFKRVQLDDIVFSGVGNGLLLRQNAHAWNTAMAELGAIAQLQPDWDSYDGVPPERNTLAYAFAELRSLAAMQLPPPSISPSGDGSILASWRGGGIEVELWFEGPNQETAVIEDDRGEIAPFAGPDPLLVEVACAVRGIKSRT